MNGFEQIKAFYSWVFNNPDKIRPTHISLYLFLWNQANRANWAEWIKCPYDLAMQGACIGNKGTYYRCLDDLKDFKLIDYKKGINNFKAPLVHLIQLYNSGQLTEQVTVPLSEPQNVPLSVLQCEPQYAPQYAPIYKHITNNLKLITDNEEDFFSAITNLGISKRKEITEVNKSERIAKIQGEFFASLKPFEIEFTPEVIAEFYNYWSEPNKSMTKIKQELESTWDTKKRLTRWVSNNFKSNKIINQPEAKPKFKPDQW